MALRFAVFQMLILLVVIGATIYLLHSWQRRELLEQSDRTAQQLGQRLAAELETRLADAEARVTGMARLAAALPKDDNVFRSIVPQILGADDPDSLIAGGGIWPEPGAFRQGSDRFSFFWGRNEFGELVFFDNYNREGYHRREWYVPGAHLQRGSVYWSRSYTDPYTLEPMVTCTTPIIDTGELVGMATINLKLDGLAAFLEQRVGVLDGYIIALDRNNKLLSFPRRDQAYTDTTREDGTVIRDYRTMSGISLQYPAYGPLTQVVEDMNADQAESVAPAAGRPEDPAERIYAGTDRVRREEARLIAALVTYGAGELDPKATRHMNLKEDPLLGEDARAFIFLMPRTFWKIILVMSNARFSEVADRITLQVARLMLGLELAALMLTFFYVRRRIVAPMRGMAAHMHRSARGAGGLADRLDESTRNELGRLAHEFNHRTNYLIDEIVERRRAETDLRYSEDRFDLFMQHLPGLAYIKDESRRILFLNDSFERMGIDREAWYGKTVLEVRSSDTTRKIDEYDRWVLTHNEPLEVVEEVPTSNGMIYFLAYRFPIPREGKPTLLGGVSIDVTELRRTREELERANLELEDRVRRRTAELEEKNRELEATNRKILRTQNQLIVQAKMASLGAMVAGVAHEIRNPLNFIGNLSEVLVELTEQLRVLLRDQCPSVNPEILEEARELLDDMGNNARVIHRHGTRAESIVKRMNELAEKGTGAFQEVPLVRLVRRHMEKVEQLDKAAGVHLIQELACEPVIQGEPHNLGRVLGHLIDNALDALNERAAMEGYEEYRPTLKVWLKENEDHVELGIWDNGTGIQDSVCPHIFEPLFTTKPSGKGNIGMGLSISYDIVVSEHEGKLDVDSEYGVYTCMLICLPYSAQEAG
ncbi:MAG: ATP-binding protein [Acidobacteriota bacterium]|nr:ATP-binding protein [Acidobacteriota bacterium]